MVLMSEGGSEDWVDTGKLWRQGSHWAPHWHLPSLGSCLMMKRRAVLGRSHSREGEAASLKKGNSESFCLQSWNQKKEMAWRTEPMAQAMVGLFWLGNFHGHLFLCVQLLWALLLHIIGLSWNLQFPKRPINLLFWIIRREEIPDQVYLLRDLGRSPPAIRKPIFCLDIKVLPGIKQEGTRLQVCSE